MGASDQATEKKRQRTTTTTLIFTYGTLKQGFSNHVLLQNMMATGDAYYLGVYATVDKLPLVCGPYRVPFLLNFPGSGHKVTGELYAVSDAALARMDELEGTTRGHYERLPIKVEPTVPTAAAAETTAIEAYYAHRSYAEGLWKKNGERGLTEYTKKETKGYVNRRDRPPHLTLLDHIRIFLSPSDSD